MIRFLYTSVFIGVLTGSAHADWQYSKWGMSPEEVTTASEGLAIKPVKPDKYDDGLVIHLLSAPYETGRFKFESKFWFDNTNSNLVMVQLDLQDINKCGLLRRELSDIYGASEIGLSKLVNDDKWRDEDNGNIITLTSYDGAFCTLDYKPIVEPGKSGL